MSLTYETVYLDHCCHLHTLDIVETVGVIYIEGRMYRPLVVIYKHETVCLDNWCHLHTWDIVFRQLLSFTYMRQYVLAVGVIYKHETVCLDNWCHLQAWDRVSRQLLSVTWDSVFRLGFTYERVCPSYWCHLHTWDSMFMLLVLFTHMRRYIYLPSALNCLNYCLPSVTL